MSYSECTERSLYLHYTLEISPLRFASVEMGCRIFSLSLMWNVFHLDRTQWAERSHVLRFTEDFSATLRFGRNGLSYLLFVINVKCIPSRPNTVSGEISCLAIYWRFLRYASLRSKWIGIFYPGALCPLRTLAISSLSSADSPSAYLADEKSFGFSTQKLGTTYDKDVHL